MKMFQGALTRSFERWAEHVEKNGDEAEIEAGSDEDVAGGADPIVRAATTRSHSSRAKA